MKTYTCKDCNWQGPTEDLNWDNTETCMGNDLIEICPVCGSMAVYQVFH